MDRIKQYRQIIRDFLENFAADDPEAQLIFDTERDRYLVMHNGWRGEYRIYGCAMQLDLIESKVWIQHNSTEIFIDRELIGRGIAPQDIVLGFRSPSVRQRLTAALHKDVVSKP
ncbi:XisI protein [Tolypothrix sp. VBCCA 56010]|uniref:XisI protein n=1 Tax=Tolypothrix sp. VBCCA 56010 TaxID=3137731 RepID=UPI003D7DB9CB